MRKLLGEGERGRSGCFVASWKIHLASLPTCKVGFSPCPAVFLFHYPQKRRGKREGNKKSTAIPCIAAEMEKDFREASETGRRGRGGREKRKPQLLPPPSPTSFPPLLQGRVEK